MTEEQLVDTYGPMVYRVAYSYTHNAFDADDVYSETFLRYFRRPRQFQSEDHRKAWLLRVAVNCAKDLWREQTDAVFLKGEPADEGGMVSVEESLDLRACVEGLEPLTCAAVYLFYYEQLPIVQVAGMLGMTEDAVKSRLKRARQRLRLELAET